MSFLLHDSMGEFEPADLTVEQRPKAGKKRTSARQRYRIIEGKLGIPDIGPIAERGRLFELLHRSVKQYGATLVSGRAGTGKTTLASQYADRQKNACWYSIEPADSDWREFSSCFSACLFPKGRRTLPKSIGPSDADISEYLTRCFARFAKRRFTEPRLIVLDNVQHLFDAEWFGSFFKQLITSLNNDARLLLLCRSKPAAPLWRLRSKQMLNVIDESVLNLTGQEAVELGEARGASINECEDALDASYGRIGAFLKEIESRRTQLSRK